MIPGSYEHPAWFCLRSQPRQEHVAAAHLKRLDRIEVFCPRLRVKRTNRNAAAMTVTEALFPGYLFARFDVTLDYRNVRYAHGVSSIVQFGERFAAVDDDVISELRRQTSDDTVLVVTPELVVGTPVTIVAGAFRGMTATITALRPSERVRVLLEFLGRSMAAEVSTADLYTDARHPLSHA